jgi:hypothetical protein
LGKYEGLFTVMGGYGIGHAESKVACTQGDAGGLPEPWIRDVFFYHALWKSYTGLRRMNEFGMSLTYLRKRSRLGAFASNGFRVKSALRHSQR